MCLNPAGCRVKIFTLYFKCTWSGNEVRDTYQLLCTNNLNIGTYNIVCGVRVLSSGIDYFLVSFSLFGTLVESLGISQFHKCSQQPRNAG